MNAPTMKEIKSRYSVKRKRDFITFFAIFMFLILVFFQLFLTLVVPVLLKKKNAFEFHIAKLQMSEQIDRLRVALYYAKAKGDLQKGEVMTVRRVADHYAMFTRETLDQLNLKQIFQLKRIFSQYEAIVQRWGAKTPRYHVVQESIPVQDLVGAVEKEIKE